MHGTDNIYWLFSSAAQSVASFTGILFAGFALVLMMMDSAADADETLLEIHEELKRQYYQQLQLLAVVVASAIICSFLIIFLNHFNFTGPWFLSFAVLSFVLVVAAIVGGMTFVIGIADPAKYRHSRAAACW